MMKSAEILFVLMLAVGSCVGCTVSDHLDPKARFEIELTDDEMNVFLRHMESFAETNGFSFQASDNLPRGDRRVWRARLEREDGTIINADNFIDEATMVVFFYAKSPDAAWQHSKESWLYEMKAALGGATEVVEVAIDSPE